MAYKNSDSKLKQVVRDRLLGHCIDIGLPSYGPISIFSLPADNFITEQMFINQYQNPRITCVERDKELYQNVVFGKMEIDNLREIDYKLGNDNEVLEESLDRYHIIWLDYCCSLRPKLLWNLIPVVQGRYSSFTDSNKALISITLMRGREYYMKDMVYYSGSENNNDYRINKFPEQLKNCAKSNNKDLKLIKTLTYKDIDRNPKACTMITYIFELTDTDTLRIDQL